MAFDDSDIAARLIASHEHLRFISGGRLERSIYSDAANEITRLRKALVEAPDQWFGHVDDAGGGLINVMVDRDTESYPPTAIRVAIRQLSKPRDQRPEPTGKDVSL